ncbi:MAG: D-aminoacyl-tRNA deacylase [Lentisphaeria bacterium]|nr:D-aminoacyl-tRNA deacylase [Lentisphaeria bacterium]
MRATIQRVNEASVKIDGKIVGKINTGLLVLLGVHGDDTEKDVDWMVNKIVYLRIFSNAQGNFDHSLLDIEGQLLVVSQFTLYGDSKKGRRPNFSAAARPELANALYEKFVERTKAMGIDTQTGQFGASMEVSLVNDGPVTLNLNTDKT